MSSGARSPGGRGLRSEAALVLPLALALFAVLSGITLAFYRSSVSRAAAERESEALALVGRLAETRRPSAARLEEWRAQLPPGAALAVIGADDQIVAAAGPLDEPLPLALLARARASGSATADPRQLGHPHVTALVPLTSAGELLRLDLLAVGLAAEQRTVRLLTPFVLTLAVGAAIVVALFFRALSRPYETLLARARAVTGAEASPTTDELEFLVSTFDRALSALGAPEGDLGALTGTLGRSLDGGFLLLDPERHLLVATPAAMELLGASSAKVGEPVRIALAEVPEVAESLVSALDPGKGGSSRRRIRLADERGGRHLALTHEPLRGADGRLRGWLVVVADETAASASEARSRLAEGLAQLGELSAGVAHELRNGLAALGGWIELAERRSSDATTREYLTEIQRESRQLARVVDDFLAFARPRTRRLATCDLVDLVRRAAHDPLFSPPGIHLAVEVERAEIVGDAELLERGLRNLLTNARHAQADVGSAEPIDLRLDRSPAGWRITVADRGPGIAPEIRPHLFEPFASGRDGGVGLGLALARRVVVLHGGGLEAKDRSGGGTVFTMVLPIDVIE